MTEYEESQCIGREPCPECGSRDNLARYDDGHAHCYGFGCGYRENADGRERDTRVRKEPVPNLLTGEAIAIRKRGLTVEACEKYRYHIAEMEDGSHVQIATYYDINGNPVAQKVRGVDKKFFIIGSLEEATLYGQQLWGQGGKRVVITEGEIDAVTLAQAMNLRWPVVSIPNGCQGARKAVAAQLPWLMKFAEIVFMFDSDEQGRGAAQECAELFPAGKAKIATLPLHDANEMVLAGLTEDLVRSVWEATAFRPDGIVNGAELWEQVSTSFEHGLSYPWLMLDEKTYGMRPRELVTWAAGTGIGKSSFVREVAYHLAQTHGQKVGVIALEESVRSAGLCQMSIEANRQLHLPPVRDAATDEEMRGWFDKTLGTGQYVFYDHCGAIDAETLLPRIRFMVHAEGCRWIILDHISIMVSGDATQGDERKRIDELMTKLYMLVEEMNIGLHLVTHLRKSGGKPHEEGGKVSLIDLRGSGSIAHVSDIVIALERDQQSKDKAHVTMLRVLKNRFCGMTGVAGELEWDQNTGRLYAYGGMGALEEGENPTTREDF